MGYLEPAEYAAYGLTAETSDDWVVAATAMMDGYCRRPTILAATYTERMRVTRGAGAVRLSYLPLVTMVGTSSPVVQARARFGTARRGEVLDGFRDEIARVFQAAGSWTDLSVTDLDTDSATGEVTLPGNFLGLPYNEVEIVYTAGLLEAPTALKVACAQVVRNAQATPALNVRASKVDTLQLEYFSGALLDEQVKSLLRPYVAQRLG